MKQLDQNNKAGFPAHIKQDNIIQNVQEHCNSTADIAALILNSLNMESVGKYAGIIHDMGKYTDEFRQYIIKASQGENVCKGSVNHTFAGVRYILNTERNNEDPWSLVTTDMLAYTVGAHHGLFDCVSKDKKSGYKHRLTAKINYEEALKEFLLGYDKDNLHHLFSDAEKETREFVSKIPCLDPTDNSELCFYMGLVMRTVLSALIDADRIDTESFMTGRDKSEFNGITEMSPEEKAEFWNKYLEKLLAKLDTFDKTTDINQARCEISRMCEEAGTKKGGIYRLLVPTGGSKTLSSLRGAFKHASVYGKDRIIITTPLLGIIDQNSDVIKNVINDNSIILEHHSNVVQEDNTSKDEIATRKIMTENWNAPVIITTMVQLLNTMFGGKTSNIRRFHALCNSVIIIDEVQSIPTKLITMFNLMVNYLAYVCKATVILCSATQPCFEKAPHAIKLAGNFIDVSDELKNVFRRTKLEYLGAIKTRDIPENIKGILKENNSSLIICNTKKTVRILYRMLKEQYHNVYYFSASMCTRHREYIRKRIEKHIADGEPVICVSTQAMEAGIDISFSCVIRLTCGLDSIVQAAGRCNRNGESKALKTVYIITCVDEDLSHLKDIAIRKQAMLELLHIYEQDKNRFNNDLASDKAVQFYFKKLFDIIQGNGGSFDFYVDGISLYDLLSLNEIWADETAEGIEENYQYRQAFKTAGDLFSVFDTNTTDVIVRYEESTTLIDKLLSDNAQNNFKYRMNVIKKLKPYTISLYDNQLEKLQETGGLEQVYDGNILILKSEYYNEEIGLNITNEICN